MKRWALLTVALYLATLSLIALPSIFLLSSPTPRALTQFYGYFVLPLLLILGALLLVPVDVARERPVRRRSVLVSAIAGALPMTLLFTILVISVSDLIWTEKGIPNVSDLIVYAWIAVFWLVWGVIFYRSYSSTNPRAFPSRLTRWMLGGSILETVVAIPAHIVARRRGECCAPGITLTGIVLGLAVALMSFGPGVFYLIAKRVKEKRRAAPMGGDSPPKSTTP